MPNQITVEDAYPPDFEAAYAIHKAAFHPKSPDFMSFESFKSLANQENGGLLCAKAEDRRVLGYVLYRTIGPEAELLSIAVEETQKKQGIGKALMQTLVERLKSAGCAALYLEVNTENLPAIRLYEAFSGTVQGRRKGYYTSPDGQKQDALVLKMPVC